MTILEKIKSKRLVLKKNRDLGQAYKIYTVVLGEFERVSKSIDDKGAQKILTKMVKDLKDTQDKSGQDNSVEIGILKEFLPEEMSVAKINELAHGCESKQEFMQSLNQYARTNGLSVDNKAAMQIFLNKKGL